MVGRGVKGREGDGRGKGTVGGEGGEGEKGRDGERDIIYLGILAGII